MLLLHVMHIYNINIIHNIIINESTHSYLYCCFARYCVLLYACKISKQPNTLPEGICLHFHKIQIHVTLNIFIPALHLLYRAHE